MTMKTSGLIVAVPAFLLLAACATTPGMNSEWTHQGLNATQSQQEHDKCTARAAETEKAYVAANSKYTGNSNSPFFGNMKARQRGLKARDEDFAACMTAAGFVTQ
jgi:hypothetical protein